MEILLRLESRSKAKAAFAYWLRPRSPRLKTEGVTEGGIEGEPGQPVSYLPSFLPLSSGVPRFRHDRPGLDWRRETEHGRMMCVVHSLNVNPIILGVRVAWSRVLAASGRRGEFTQPLSPILSDLREDTVSQFLTHPSIRTWTLDSTVRSILSLSFLLLFALRGRRILGLNGMMSTLRFRGYCSSYCGLKLLLYWVYGAKSSDDLVHFRITNRYPRP